MYISPIFAIDGYKLGHRQQYPKGTTRIFGNFTPRSNKHFKSPFFKEWSSGSPLIWAGTQALLMQWVSYEFREHFFKRPQHEVVEKMKNFCDHYIGKDAVPVDGIKALHQLGYLPLTIKTIPEGSMVQMKTPVLTIQNTLDDFFWLVNYLETLFSAELWPVATAATIIFNYRCIGEYWAHLTCDNKDHIPFQFHDFAARGNMGMWANSLTGMGHLFGSHGTDSVFAYQRLETQYPAKKDFIGMSVNATEHSVMCMGEKVSEIETFRRLLEEVYPTGILSIVSDTWDYWKVITKFLPELKEIIKSRDGKLVVRPDSGNPVDIICGRLVVDFESCTHMGEVQTQAAKNRLVQKKNAVVQFHGEYFEFCEEGMKRVPAHVVNGSIAEMWKTFGGHVNRKGFKVLDPKIGLIYGDSITMELADEIFERLAAKGFASSNVVLGIGSYTYQYVTRDTFGFAMKATWGVVNGEEREVFKDPATDDGTKKSHKGLLYHHLVDGQWVFHDQATPAEEKETQLITVFQNGVITNPVSLDEVRARVDANVETCVKAKLLLMEAKL